MREDMLASFSEKSKALSASLRDLCARFESDGLVSQSDLLTQALEGVYTTGSEWYEEVGLALSKFSSDERIQSMAVHELVLQALADLISTEKAARSIHIR